MSENSNPHSGNGSPITHPYIPLINSVMFRMPAHPTGGFTIHDLTVEFFGGNTGCTEENPWSVQFDEAGGLGHKFELGVPKPLIMPEGFDSRLQLKLGFRVDESVADAYYFSNESFYLYTKAFDEITDAGEDPMVKVFCASNETEDGVEVAAGLEPSAVPEYYVPVFDISFFIVDGQRQGSIVLGTLIIDP